MQQTTLVVLAEAFTIHRLAPEASIPDAVSDTRHWWVGRTGDELSIVCDSSIAIPEAPSDSGWSAFRVAGAIDFAVTGLLARIAGTLAEAGISLFALSTFDTDYVLGRSEQLPGALGQLRAAGFNVQTTYTTSRR